MTERVKALLLCRHSERAKRVEEPLEKCTLFIVNVFDKDIVIDSRGPSTSFATLTSLRMTERVKGLLLRRHSERAKRVEEPLNN